LPLYKATVLERTFIPKALLFRLAWIAPKEEDDDTPFWPDTATPTTVEPYLIKVKNKLTATPCFKTLITVFNLPCFKKSLKL
jgi:hypothetical protein